MPLDFIKLPIYPLLNQITILSLHTPNYILTPVLDQITNSPLCLFKLQHLPSCLIKLRDRPYTLLNYITTPTLSLIYQIDLRFTKFYTTYLLVILMLLSTIVLAIIAFFFFYGIYHANKFDVIMLC